MKRDAATVRAYALVVASVVAYLLVRVVTVQSSIDLEVYRIEGQAVWSHTYIYGRLATPQDLVATYPPFAAIVFVLFIWLPGVWLRAVMLVANMCLLLGVAALSCRLVGVERHLQRVAVPVIFAVALWSEPVFTTLRNGQINLVLLALVLWDFTRPPHSRGVGIGVGIAAAVKVTPAIFVVYLLFTRRFRAAATAGATFVVAIAISAVVLPHATARYWTALVFDTARVGHLEDESNQSLLGVLVRLHHSRLTTPLDTLFLAAVTVAGLACAVLAHRRLGDRWGVPACAVTSLLVAPIAWTHHWVWIVPIAVLLWQEARYWVVPVAVLFWTHVVWAVPHRYTAELRLSPAQIALSTVYAAAGVGFLLLTTYRAVSTARRSSVQAEL